MNCFNFVTKMAGMSTDTEADLNNSYARFTLAEEEEGGILVAGAEDDDSEALLVYKY